MLSPPPHLFTVSLPEVFPFPNGCGLGGKVAGGLSSGFKIGVGMARL